MENLEMLFTKNRGTENMLYEFRRIPGMIRDNMKNPIATKVEFTDTEMMVHLSNGKILSVPLNITSRLLHATHQERMKYHFIGNGVGIKWPDLDEDLSVNGLIRDYGN